MDWAQDEQKPGEAHTDSKMGGDMDTKMDTQMDTEMDMKIGFGRDSMDWIQNNHQLHPPPPAAPVSDTAKSTAKSTDISAQSAGPKLEDYKLLKVLGKVRYTIHYLPYTMHHTPYTHHTPYSAR
jgi:hypothetical protein